MATYRLVWSGDGALDLSQILDTRGRPIVLSPRQRIVSIASDVLKSPYLQRYLATPHLKAELLDGSVTPTVPPPTTPPAPVVIAKATPVVSPEPVTPPVKTEVDVSDPIMTKETLTVETSSAEPPSPSTPPSDTEGTESKGGFKGRKGGRK